MDEYSAGIYAIFIDEAVNAANEAIQRGVSASKIFICVSKEGRAVQSLLELEARLPDELFDALKGAEAKWRTKQTRQGRKPRKSEAQVLMQDAGMDAPYQAPTPLQAVADALQAGTASSAGSAPVASSAASSSATPLGATDEEVLDVEDHHDGDVTFVGETHPLGSAAPVPLGSQRLSLGRGRSSLSGLDSFLRTGRLSTGSHGQGAPPSLPRHKEGLPEFEEDPLLAAARKARRAAKEAEERARGEAEAAAAVEARARAAVLAAAFAGVAPAPSLPPPLPSDGQLLLSLSQSRPQLRHRVAQLSAVREGRGKGSFILMLLPSDGGMEGGGGGGQHPGLQVCLWLSRSLLMPVLAARIGDGGEGDVTLHRAMSQAGVCVVDVQAGSAEQAVAALRPLLPTRDRGEGDGPCAHILCVLERASWAEADLLTRLTAREQAIPLLRCPVLAIAHPRVIVPPRVMQGMLGSPPPPPLSILQAVYEAGVGVGGECAAAILGPGPPHPFPYATFPQCAARVLQYCVDKAGGSVVEEGAAVQAGAECEGVCSHPGITLAPPPALYEAHTPASVDLPALHTCHALVQGDGVAALPLLSLLLAEWVRYTLWRAIEETGKEGGGGFDTLQAAAKAAGRAMEGAKLQRLPPPPPPPLPALLSCSTGDDVWDSHVGGLMGQGGGALACPLLSLMCAGMRAGGWAARRIDAEGEGAAVRAQQATVGGMEAALYALCEGWEEGDEGEAIETGLTRLAGVVGSVPAEAAWALACGVVIGVVHGQG